MKYKNSHHKIRTINLNFKKTHKELKLVIIYNKKAKQLFAHNNAVTQTSLNMVKQLKDKTRKGENIHNKLIKKKKRLQT